MEGENLNKQQRNENSMEIPKSIVIKGYTLFYKSPPLKNDIYLDLVVEKVAVNIL